MGRGDAAAGNTSGGETQWDYPTKDIQCLRDVRDFLLKIGVIFETESRPLPANTNTNTNTKGS